MKERIREYIGQEIAGSPDLLPIGDSTELIQSGILDSLSLLKLALFLDEAFGITVAPEDLTLDNFASVQAIGAYVEARGPARSK